MSIAGTTRRWLTGRWKGARGTMRRMEGDRSERSTTEMAGAASRGKQREGIALRGAVIERVMERVLASFRRLVKSPADAEECAQRTLIALERSLREGKYDPAKSFNAWIWLKAHSVFCDWCRERGRRMEALPDADALAPAATASPVPGRGLSAGVEERMDAEAVMAAVEARLGAEALECFVLRYEGDLSLEEIAETVGRDRRTVAARLKAAHALIDRLLGKEGGE